MLSKPKRGESLLVYLAISKLTVSSILIRKENSVQWPVYYVIKISVER